MSGGVDSSLAAKLMIDQGYDCIGCTMKLYNNEDLDLKKSRTCCSLDDIWDAKSVAYKLGMPFYVFNFTEAFKKLVIDKFVKSYEKGMTPNPCIDCNRYMKFDKLFERGKILGCDYIVSGHYARIEYKDGKYLLKKALDKSKDQSYVLYSLTQEQLAHTKFPLGEMKKTDVRILAEKNDFINSNKPDSQDICFVPNKKYGEFIEKYSGKISPSGDFIDLSGKIIGTHKGIIQYTLGQHKKLGSNLSRKMYVCKICPENNTITLGDEKELLSKEVIVKDFNWIAGIPLKDSIRCMAKTRYSQKEEWVTAIPLDENSLCLIFDIPQRAVTPGQAAVLYDGDIVLGGGTISIKK